MIQRLSKEHYTPIELIRFVRIMDNTNNIIYLNLYISHTNRKDNYYSIMYDTNSNNRYLLYSVNKQKIVWQD